MLLALALVRMLFLGVGMRHGVTLEAAAGTPKQQQRSEGQLVTAGRHLGAGQGASGGTR